MNNLKSYTEYAVTSSTTDFVIGFDFNYGTDAVNVTVDNVPATEAGHTVVYLNSTTIRLTPAVTSGVVRLQRETDIDAPDNRFTAGAKFIAGNMDENFTQVRHAQQEVKDLFTKLSLSTDAALVAVDSAVEAAGEATSVALAAAGVANNAAGLGLEFKSGVNYYASDVSTALGGYPLHAEIMLANGDVVKSTVANNTKNPNVDMTGWLKIGDEWVDITNLLIVNEPLAKTWNRTVINNAIIKAKAEKKGVTCAPKGTIHVEGNLDFKFIQYIKIYSDILNATGTVVVGGFADSANPVDITFQRITNGTSAVAGAIPTIDTFRCEGIKAGHVEVGQTNLLRIHAVGGDLNRGSNAYFALRLGGSVRAFRVSDEGVGGWNNEFVVTGGRIIDLDVTGTGYVPNSIQFDSNVFEGALVKIRFKNAWTNRITNARFENTTTSAGIIFEADTMQNTVICKWDGSGSTRGMFTFHTPVSNLGMGNICTTQNAIDCDAIELFGMSSNSEIISNAASSACIDNRVGRVFGNLVNKNIIQPTLNGFTVEANKVIALSDMVEVQNGDVIKFDCDYDGALLRPIIAIYDANKQLITSGSDLISVAGGTFASAEGFYTTTADRTAVALQGGASVNSDLVKYIRVGCFSSVGGVFKGLSAYLYTQKLLRSESKAMARGEQITPNITGLPTSGFASRDTKLFETTSKQFLNCSSSVQTFTTAATTGDTLTVKRSNGVSVGSIIGVLDSAGGTVWAKCTAVTTTTITLDTAVPVNANALVVANKWDAIGISPAATQANSSASTLAGLVADHNALLAKLKASGVML